MDKKHAAPLGLMIAPAIHTIDMSRPWRSRSAGVKLQRLNQKRISKSLMPFHFPGTFGSNEVLSTQVP